MKKSLEERLKELQEALENPKPEEITYPPLRLVVDNSRKTQPKGTKS